MRALARVRHPNVVRLFGACVEVDAPFVVMAWAAGGSLQQALDEGRLAAMRLAEHLSLLCGIARGMEAVRKGT